MTQTTWTTNKIRRTYLDFFKGKGHKEVESDSLVPQGDPTLLFTGAGMNQFKEYFLGIKKDMTRSTTSQKCLRTGDLDNVGRTPYHHSFFEMLGNFSFGNYFKKEAIEWSFELLNDHFKIPRERLRVSVHESDDEAFKIWRDHMKVPEKWIAKLGDHSNFWPADAIKEGPNGPCGPCSEIFYDQGSDYGCGKPECGVDCDCGRFAEIWNLVFTQYDRQDGGKLVPLAQKNIDTGAGLERWACVLQGKKNNFETDGLQPLVDFLHTELKGPKLETGSPLLPSARMIVDHARAAAFTIADGVIPSNEGRGYVVRKLIRRAIWKGRTQLFSRQPAEPFLFKMAERVAEIMKEPYPYLKREMSHIQTILKGEEERFLQTLEEGQRLLDQVIDKIKKGGKNTVPAEDAFKLYDTYGFPDELTQTIAKERGLDVDTAGVEKLMEEQRKRAKEATKIEGAIFVADKTDPELAKQPVSRFLGYETLEAEGQVLYAGIEKGEGWVLLDQTPFYAEKGGQVGDKGVLEWSGGRAAVRDTQWKDKWILHQVKIEKGDLKKGVKVKAVVDEITRERTRRHHTATHILQAALRNILGTHVRQLGSLVNPEKLRFDFSHPKALTSEEIAKIEKFVNDAILKNLTVCTEIKSFKETQDAGVLSFFGEKYEEKVRVLDVGNGLSKELCGGTHVRQTGDIGSFIITSEASIASGTRRIEAVAGMAAVEYAQKARQQLSSLAQALKSSQDEVLDRVSKLQEKVKTLQKGGAPSGKTSREDIDAIAKDATDLQGVQLVFHDFKDVDVASLRGISDQLRAKIQKEPVVILFTQNDESLSFVTASGSDRVDASAVAKKIATLVEGSGGGKKDFAQGGSKRPDLVTSVKEKIPALVQEVLRK